MIDTQETHLSISVLTAVQPTDAQALAELLGCGCDDTTAVVQLLFVDGALAMQFNSDDAILNGCKPISFSFADYDMHSRGGADIKQILFRACGVNRGSTKKDPPRILDCCAGAGGDGFMLQSQGATVLSCERNPTVYHVLHDALRREIHSNRWSLQAIDARTYIEAHPDIAALHDVIYIDPMFRSERKRSGAEGKVMRALRCIAGDDLDSDDLVSAAGTSNIPIVVLKRPLRSQAYTVTGRHRTHSLKGKGHRFDVYRAP